MGMLSSSMESQAVLCSATWLPNTLLRVGVAQADVKLTEVLNKEFECRSTTACECVFMP